MGTCWDEDELPDAAVMGSACAEMKGHGAGMLQEVEAVSCWLTSCVTGG